MMNRYRVIMGRSKVTSFSLDADDGDIDSAAVQADEATLQKMRDMETMQDLLDRIKGCIDPESYKFLLEYFSSETTAKSIAEKYNASEASVWMRRHRLIQKIRYLLCNAILTSILLESLSFTTFSRNGTGDPQQIPSPSGTKGSDDNAPTLRKQDAETILHFLEHIPSEQIDMQLADICLSVLNDGPIYAEQGNVWRAVRAFNRRIADHESERGAHEGSGMRFGKRAIVVLVVLGCLIVATAVAYALGWLPWIKAIWWDDEQYHYNITVTEEMAGDSYTQFLPTGLDASLDQALEEYGINIPLLTWIPDGYGDLAFKVVDLEDSITFYIYLLKDDNTLSIIVTKYLGTSEVYDKGIIEKDEEYFEEYRKGETVYTIMSNIGWLNAVWMEQPYHCKIGGYVSADDLRRMIDSIYERG